MGYCRRCWDWVGAYVWSRERKRKEVVMVVVSSMCFKHSFERITKTLKMAVGIVVVVCSYGLVAVGLAHPLLL